MKKISKITIFAVSMVTVFFLFSFKNKQHCSAAAPPPDSTIAITDMEHYLDGVPSTLSAVNTIGEAGITHCIMPGTEETKAYWFTSEANFTSWIADKSYKDEVLNNLAEAEAASNEPCPECENVKRENSPSPKNLSFNVWGYAFENANGSGSSNTYLYWHKTLNSFNNKASLVGIGGPTLVGSCAWFTEKKFKGTKLIMVQVPIFAKYKDLTGNFMNDNIESCY